MLLIVGNGLSIDLCLKHLGLVDLDPSSPFHFNVPNPCDKTLKLLDGFPLLTGLIVSQPFAGDYEIVHKFTQVYSKDNEQHRETHFELRPYLQYAYSYASQVVQNQWREGWRWQHWLNRERERIAGVVSFNYDLFVEIALDKTGIGCHRLGSTEEVFNPVGVPVFKPHGSCDFDTTPGGMVYEGCDPHYLGVRTELCQTGFAGFPRCMAGVVPRARICTQRRAMADVVLPFEVSQQTHLDWVVQGYEATSRIAEGISVCVIVGLSYEGCDRREIDLILSFMSRQTKVHLVNPNPNQEFVQKLNRTFDDVSLIAPDEFLR